VLAQRRILVVDDEEDNREVLKVMLEEYGAHVVTAASAAEALQAVREGRPELLVSDIGMPGEDGYRLIAQVRALPAEEGGGVPAVAITAYARVQASTCTWPSPWSPPSCCPSSPTWWRSHREASSPSGQTLAFTRAGFSG
jgi:CheY-like chemotaxis protein